ncbi:hypothetical protein CP533_0878 [Ophiocordyceps camponoti-saundersi (nom. inval.)]|nr:hypothetical protein CP533_0878 [Ophiocordyceps camponoti-saundersi (nom. inval.)]
MTADPASQVQDFYRDRSVFCTGATGMLGLAYLVRLLLDTPVSHVYAMARGGEKRMWQVCSEYLSSDQVEALQKSGRLTVFDGDITHPNLGLSEDQIDTLRKKVSVVVHAASTVNLVKPLHAVADVIIYSSLAIADFVLSLSHLERFVYVSTAYSSTFLRRDLKGNVIGSEAVITEKVHQLRTMVETAEAELADIREYGTTPEFNFADYLYPYSYAKNLTERLLISRFEKHGQADKLLIFRPSIIGPAEQLPRPNFEIAGSTPVTTFMAAAIMTPPLRMCFASPLDDPSTATIDEVPVDIVVNRLVVHTAYGSAGPVHAASGRDGRVLSETLWLQALDLRRWWWWKPSGAWTSKDWSAKGVCKLSRLFKVCGCDFVFDQAKSEAVWASMSESEKSRWPFWPTPAAEDKNHALGREKALKLLCDKFASRTCLPTMMTRCMYNL